MTLCNNCLKPITSQYHYSPDKNDDKKFCCSRCMYEHYGQKCEKCGKILSILFEKDGKKFCGTTCMNSYHGEKTKESASQFWEKYKGWIIGGGILLVILIIIGLVFGNKKKR